MPNERNLLPPFQSPDVARGGPRDAAVNGRKSGARRRQKKEEKTCIVKETKRMLYKPVTDQKQLAMIAKSGMPVPKTPLYVHFLVASVMMKSIKKGSIDDMIKLTDFIGEEYGSSIPANEAAEDELSTSLRELAQELQSDDQ